MDITPAVPDTRLLVDSYGPGRFLVRGTPWQGSILLFPDVCKPWEITSIADLTLDVLQPVREAVPKVEILLLGTGATSALVPSKLRAEIRAAGIVMDIMDTGAACRTFNVLMVEGRRAAAALIAA